MDLIQAIILGLVQGLTEFLPISSTAHIRILPALLGWEDPGASFTAVIQLGTLLAVLVYFASDLVRAVGAWAKSLTDAKVRRSPDARLGWAVFVGTIPIVVLGVAYKDSIEGSLRSLHVVAWSLIGMGVLLLVSEMVTRHRRPLADVKTRDGLWVGMWQAIALIPGASRSGSTITGSLLAGFDRPTAAKFSFLLSVPSIAAAAVFSIWEHRELFSGPLLVPAIVSNVVSFISGYAAIAWLLRLLQTRSTLGFVLYRIALGVLILVLVQSGRIPAEGLAGGH